MEVKYVVLVSKIMATRYIFNKYKMFAAVLVDIKIINKFL